MALPSRLTAVDGLWRISDVLPIGTPLKSASNRSRRHVYHSSPFNAEVTFSCCSPSMDANVGRVIALA